MLLVPALLLGVVLSPEGMGIFLRMDKGFWLNLI